MKVKTQVQVIEVRENTSASNRDKSKSKRETNRKHKRFVSRFEHQALRPRIHRVKDFTVHNGTYTKEL